MEDIRHEIGLEKAAHNGIIRQESQGSDEVKEKVHVSEPTKIS